MNTIGDKRTFWQIVYGKDAKNILIPEIQRDYTYGSQTEHTDKVLNNMLDNIERTLYKLGSPEMTMNFIYGYTVDEVNYVPLDGQQRLTTLFLLHYYAALYNNDADFNALEKFTYATRETTKNYCSKLIENHSEILKNRENHKSLNEAICDLPWYLPNYKNDPSIKSMQVVLSRIEKKFEVHKEDLWNKLTADDCPINFYKLDFGPFGLSDDLYVKMNSRGKKLTAYEIFKSMLLKHIEKTLGLKEYKKELAIKFDNEWTDLVWETIGKPYEEEKLVEIDNAYIHLIRLLFSILAISQNESGKDFSLTTKEISDFLGSKDDVSFIEDFLDVFVWVYKSYTSIGKGVDMLISNMSQIIKIRNPFETCLKEGRDKIKNGDLLVLIGQYWAFKNIKESVYDEERAQLNYRHLRNIVENSDDEIRKEKMTELFSEVEDVMCGRLTTKSKSEFNTNQWIEECEKENHLEEWKNIWKYEEHPLLRGAISNFAEKQSLDLSNIHSVQTLNDRLEKFGYIFDKDYVQHDRLIRAAFLCEKDYSQTAPKYEEYRILGNIPWCWRRMLVKSTQRKHQDSIMEVIDTYNVSSDSIKDVMERRILEFMIDKSTDKLNWRYYAVKYMNHTYKAYTHTDGYGYFWVPKDHVNENGVTNTLEAAILQSSYFGTSNVAWYLLNLIVKERNENKYNLDIVGTHAASGDEYFVNLKNKDKNIYLSIDRRGWYISGLSLKEATSYGIKNTKEYSDSNGNLYILVEPDNDSDYIEWCEEFILKPLETLSGFLK